MPDDLMVRKAVGDMASVIFKHLDKAVDDGLSRQEAGGKALEMAANVGVGVMMTVAAALIAEQPDEARDKVREVALQFFRQVGEVLPDEVAKAIDDMVKAERQPDK